MREAKEPLHNPLHFDKFSLVPDVCSYVSKVWKTSVIELTSERNKVVSSAYCEILTVPCEHEKTFNVRIHADMGHGDFCSEDVQGH